MLIQIHDYLWCQHDQINFINKHHVTEKAGFFKGVRDKWEVTILMWDNSPEYTCTMPFPTELDADEYIADILNSVKLAHEA